MKTKIISIVFVLSMISCMSKKDGNKSMLRAEASLATMPSVKVCESNDEVPRGLSDLNKMALLNYDFTNDCTFQPIHVKIREGEENSSEIIARFDAEEGIKNGKSGYYLNKIEFMNWEIASSPDTVIVVNPRVFDTIVEGIEYVKMEVVLQRSSFKLDENGKRDVDCKWEEGPFWIEKGAIIDIQVKNEDDIYPKQKARNWITQGKQCTGKAK